MENEERQKVRQSSVKELQQQTVTDKEYFPFTSTALRKMPRSKVNFVTEE
jgi:hypothetical protein